MQYCCICFVVLNILKKEQVIECGQNGETQGIVLLFESFLSTEL